MAQRRKKTYSNEPFLHWKIGGEAGFGIKVTGEMFSRMFMRAGYHTFEYSEYPSLIRGGHNTVQIAVGVEPVRAPIRGVNILVCLDQQTWRDHADELVDGAAVLYDTAYVKIPARIAQQKKLRLYGAPMEDIARRYKNPVMRNTVALGMSAALMQLDMKLVRSVLHTAFGKKDPSVAELNLAVAKEGASYIHGRVFKKLPPPQEKPKSLMAITGNVALALGAIRGGLQFYAGYPMTPSSAILATLAKHAETYGIVVKHAEDEISVMNMAIGAAFAGARSMVGTSGGGFALMGEALGLAGMTETGVVMVDVQRPGPATGLPTWTGQGDLRFVTHTAQDDVPRIVLAPGDVSECFFMTAEALNLAEEYQMPVIILSDKLLGESAATTPLFPEQTVKIRRGKVAPRSRIRSGKPFARYAAAADGISPRTLPGTPNGMFVANSDEHDTYGLVNETAAMRIMQHEKRLRKLETFAKKMPEQQRLGPAQADVTFIGWGSTKGVMADALPHMNRGRRKANYIHVSHIHPFPVRSVQRHLARAKRVVVIEGNATGQFAGLLREQTGRAADVHLRKYDGRPFFTGDVVDFFTSYVAKN